jgi:hypothetical protein
MEEVKMLYAGDSWAIKGFTLTNYDKRPIEPTDVRMADYWNIEYSCCFAGGQGNLALLDKIIGLNLDPAMPVVWIYTEPGRDYNRLTTRPDFEWMEREDMWEIRSELDAKILRQIKDRLPNPVALVGGLSDINVELAEQLNLHVLHPSWQGWIAKQLNSQCFVKGWGAADIGWRMHRDNVTPGRVATFAWDEQIKEWCWWEEHGYFCHEHPTPMANKKFAEYLKPQLNDWLKNLI